MRSKLLAIDPFTSCSAYPAAAQRGLGEGCSSLVDAKNVTYRVGRSRSRSGCMALLLALFSFACGGEKTSPRSLADAGFPPSTADSGQVSGQDQDAAHGEDSGASRDTGVPARLDASSAVDGSDGHVTTDGASDAEVQGADGASEDVVTADVGMGDGRVADGASHDAAGTDAQDGAVAQDGSGPGLDAGSQPVGAPCEKNVDCEQGTCLFGPMPWASAPFAAGYCTLAACNDASNPCPNGSECFAIDQMTPPTTYCLATCRTSNECRTDYGCFAPGACLPGTAPIPLNSPVGGPCASNLDCVDPGADCIPEQTNNGEVSWPSGYCYIPGCSQGTCPQGSDCFRIDDQGATACLETCANQSECTRPEYACWNPGVCFPECQSNAECAEGQICGPDGICIKESCTPTSCAQGLICDTVSGDCVADIGTPPPPRSSQPACTGSPSWQCTGTEAQCGTIEPFEPDLGPGYEDYDINGEGPSEYRSYARRDVIMLVKHAAAEVECLAGGWSFGNRRPLGLGDMSEANGAIPGTAVGSPGHPAGTHVNGHDMDIAYYQIRASDNRLRPVCPHVQGGRDQYHCVAEPNDLDIWRTALFIGKLHVSPQLRVIGVDGRIGPLVESALTQLCGRGYLPGSSACAQPRLAYETTDQGRGWFLFHHHHLHISVSGRSNLWNDPVAHQCLTLDCRPAVHDVIPREVPIENWTIERFFRR